MIVDEAIIEVMGVTLRRRTQEELGYDLKRFLFNVVRRRYRRPKRRLVLDRVDLRIERGEKIGLIGANGSGKSTLLKVICGILPASKGTVQVRGRIAPLIELGAGFDGDLSLVDNIVYYGVLLGYPKREMVARVDAILDFAELTDHRTEPVNALSSGMLARLGFAVATDRRPEILMLDEVLSVGDEAFRRKCSQRIQEFWDEHSTIIVVSHDLGFIADSCRRALWLEHGQMRMDGAASDVTQAYLAEVRRNWIAEQRAGLLGRCKTAHPGLLVQGTKLEGNRVYLVCDGVRHWVRTGDWIDASGLGWHSIESIDDAVIESIPIGEELG